MEDTRRVKEESVSVFEDVVSFINGTSDILKDQCTPIRELLQLLSQELLWPERGSLPGT